MSRQRQTDATQSTEVIFALAGEALFLQASLPNMIGLFGMLVACAGLVAFVRHEHD